MRPWFSIMHYKQRFHTGYFSISDKPVWILWISWGSTLSSLHARIFAECFSSQLVSEIAPISPTLHTIIIGLGKCHYEWGKHRNRKCTTLFCLYKNSGVCHLIYLKRFCKKLMLNSSSPPASPPANVLCQTEKWVRGEIQFAKEQVKVWNRWLNVRCIVLH